MDCKEKKILSFLFLLIEEDLKSCDKKAPFLFGSSTFLIHSENDFQSQSDEKFAKPLQKRFKNVLYSKIFLPNKTITYLG